jgi:hypothetical protein
MKRNLYAVSLCVLYASTAFASDELCVAVSDTALFADAKLEQEVRLVFQFDGAQFVPQTKDGAVMYGMAYDVRMQPMLEEGSFAKVSDWQCEASASSSGGEDVKAYDLTKDACQLDLSDTRLIVSQKSLGFYESSCDLMDEKSGEDGAKLLTLQCYGSGGEWPASGILKLRGDGSLSLQIDDFAQVYLPCDHSN